MNTRHALRALPAVLIAATLFTAARAQANPSPPLAAQYASWAGGKSNAAALVDGLRNGTPITLSTTGADRSVSLAGFTPSARLTEEEVAAALGNARASLARLGIKRPTAEQIQAALIGGEVAVPAGGTRVVAGSLTNGGGATSVVATR